MASGGSSEKIDTVVYNKCINDLTEIDVFIVITKRISMDKMGKFPKSPKPRGEFLKRLI